jgi:molybdate transport system permease protein
VPEALTHVGVRSHQIGLAGAATGVNAFPCWLVSTSEAPHEMTVYLRLHSAAHEGDLAHLQADVPKDVWRALMVQPQPWGLTLDAGRLLLLEG